MSEWMRTGEYEWTKTNREGGTPVSRTVAAVAPVGGKTRFPPGARGGSTGGNRIV